MVVDGLGLERVLQLDLQHQQRAAPQVQAQPQVLVPIGRQLRPGLWNPDRAVHAQQVSSATINIAFHLGTLDIASPYS